MIKNISYPISQLTIRSFLSFSVILSLLSFAQLLQRAGGEQWCSQVLEGWGGEGARAQRGGAGSEVPKIDKK